MPVEGEPKPDPGDPQKAIDRYRELAKYLVTIFAGVGALLVAGSQLSSLGKLSEDELDRWAASVGGLLLAIAAIAFIVIAAMAVLRPVEMSLDDVIADKKLSEAVNSRPSLLGGPKSVSDLRDLHHGFPGWGDVVNDVLGFAAYRRATDRFDRAWRRMLLGALAATVGIILFAWGSNPPEDETADPVVRPLPQVVTFRLTADGRDTFGEALGVKCSVERFRALTIGGDEKSPRVVTLPERGCNPVQFVMSPEFGAPVSTKTAPGG